MNHIIRHAKSRRAFGRVKHTQSPGSSCADIKQSSAASETFCDNVDSASNFRQDAFNGSGDFFILVVDELDHFKRGAFVNVSRRGIDFLRRQLRKIIAHVVNGASSFKRVVVNVSSRGIDFLRRQLRKIIAHVVTSRDKNQIGDFGIINGNVSFKAMNRRENRRTFQAQLKPQKRVRIRADDGNSRHDKAV